MKNLLIVLLFVTISNAKVSIKNSDYTNSQLILGYWSFTYIEKGFTFYSEYLYKKDGTKEGIAEACINKKCKKSTFESNWKIKKGFLISSVQKSSSEDLPVGIEIKDRILKLDNNVMVLLSKYGEEKDIRLKKPRFFK